MCILLCGSPPFGGEDDDEILEAVKKGVFNFKGIDKCYSIGKVWKNVSSNAKDLINKMMTYNQEKRISAAEAYQHKWFKDKNIHNISIESAKELISNVNFFHVLCV